MMIRGRRSGRIRIGVVGFGEWGPNHVRNFSSLPEARVLAIADARLERLNAAHQQFKGIRTFSTHREMLKSVPLDALVVATPTSTHAEIVRDGLEAELHVLCEKPLCSTVEEAESLIRLAEERDRLLMVGHVFLFNAGIVKLRQLVKENGLGTIHYLTCKRTNLGPIRNDVNAVWDLASHDVSIINFLLDTLPLKVSAAGHAYLQDGLEDVAFVTLTYPQGILAHVHVSWLDPVKVREMTVVGDQKMAIWNDVGPFSPLRIFDKGVMKARHYSDFGQFQLMAREGDVLIPRIAMEEPLRVQARHFLVGVQRKEECISDGNFALNVIRVLAAIDESLATGVSVSVKA